MSSTDSIRIALASLFPASTQIPPRLLSAAESLLSISRQRAGHLKPDEEIARPHVCSEIACRRLRATLRLPNIRSGNGAPCRPAVYKKLLTFFEKTLEDVELIGTPKGRKTPTGTPGKSTGTNRKRNIEVISVDEVETPTKRRRTDPFVTPTKSTGKKNGFLGRIEESQKSVVTEETPKYVLPAIRQLCKLFRTKEMVPHVYTGFCVLRSLAEEDETDHTEHERQNHLSLVVAVYLLTLTRMQDRPMTQEVYDEVLAQSIKLLKLDGRQETQSEVENWISWCNNEEWLSLPGKGQDWWSSVPEDVLDQVDPETTHLDELNPIGLSDATHVTEQRADTWQHRQKMRREELRRQLDQEDPDDVLLPGLGTMMTDALDYFSAEKTAEYEAWKADILKRLDAAEQDLTPDKAKRKGGTNGVAATTA